MESINVVDDDAFSKGESVENVVDLAYLSDDQGPTTEDKEQSIPKSPRSPNGIDISIKDPSP
ncbi:Hypothetical predicted protein, partial [Olea europaea subsp. europaea]